MATILIHTPCALGLAKNEHLASVVNTVCSLKDAGHKVFYSNTSSSSIVEARNRAVQTMLRHPDITHILFLDSDMSWAEGDAVTKMLEMDRDVIAAGYLTRSLESPNWTFVKPNEVPDLDEQGNIRVVALPTGFFLAKRSVFERIIAARPDLKVIFHPEDTDATDMYLFFDARRRKNTFKYQTDDFGFCETWEDMGGEMWLYPNVTITHWAWVGITANYSQTEEYVEACKNGKEAMLPWTK
jgi:hypothetical protein